MFASNKGDTILPVESSTDFGPLYWVASKSGSRYYVKLANYGSDILDVIVNIPKTKSGNFEMLTGPRYQGNQPFNMEILPTTSNLQSKNGTFSITMDPWAVAVLAIS